MTLQALAGSDVTIAFVSQLENGKTGASIETLEKLARRLEVSVADLLIDAPRQERERRVEVDLLLAEQDWLGGNAAAAKDRVLGLKPGTGVLQARRHRLLGQIFMAERDIAGAVRELSLAERALRADGQPEALARVRFDLAQAHSLAGQVGEALSIATTCVRLIEDGTIVDRVLEMKFLSLLAVLYLRSNDFASADLMAQRALALSNDVVDPKMLATLYTATAITRKEQGDLEGSLVYARKALEVREQTGQVADVAAELNNLATTYIQRRQFARAEDAIRQAEALVAQGVTRPQLTPTLRTTRAELDLARGDHAQALAGAEEALAVRPGDPAYSVLSQAAAALCRAKALDGLGRPAEEVFAAFRAAIEIATAAKDRRLVHAHEGFAAALAQRGRADEAYVESQHALAAMRAGSLR